MPEAVVTYLPVAMDQLESTLVVAVVALVPLAEIGIQLLHMLAVMVVVDTHQVLLVLA